jgi:hypothetical protein
LPQAQVIVLDALRKQRHLSDYSGDTVSGSHSQRVPDLRAGAADTRRRVAEKASPGTGVTTPSA